MMYRYVLVDSADDAPLH